MDLSKKIQEIQISKSNNRSRIIDEIFNRLYLDYPENAFLLQAVKKAVCDNIDVPNRSIVPIDLPPSVPVYEANSFTSTKLNLYIFKGSSGTDYISWDQKYIDNNMIKIISDRLHASGQMGFLYEELKKIQVEFPNMEIQLLVSADKTKAFELALKGKKNISCIFKDAIYILYK